MSAEYRTLKNEEKVMLKLRELYSKYGFVQYKMSKFEEYDTYVRNKDFLVSDRMITFTDTNGKLLALKPDVTISIIKNTRYVPGAVQKVYYNENVYRVSRGVHAFREIMQSGLECIGDIDLYNICEVMMLAQKSLKAISDNYVLDISHVGFVLGLIEELDLTSNDEEMLLKCIGEKNSCEAVKILKASGAKENIISKIAALIDMYGNASDMIAQMKALSVNETTDSALKELEAVCELLQKNIDIGRINIDLSVLNDMNYYNGIVFKGFVNGIPTGILSGGQYDKLLHKMGKKSGAIGFAVYLDQLERLDNDTNNFDADILLLYNDSADVEKLMRSVKLLTENGKSVSAQKCIPEGMRFSQILRFNNGGIEIVEAND